MWVTERERQREREHRFFSVYTACAMVVGLFTLFRSTLHAPFTPIVYLYIYLKRRWRGRILGSENDPPGSRNLQDQETSNSSGVLNTKVGPPERDKTDGPQELNDGWVRGHSAPQRNILKNETAEIANPVRAGFDQFLVQPHLKVLSRYKANPISKTVTPPK